MKAHDAVLLAQTRQDTPPIEVAQVHATLALAYAIAEHAKATRD